MNVESTIHPQLLESIATIRSSVDRQAEQRAEMAEESERLSNTLLDSISHEIRTPIAVITTAAGTLNAARDPSLTQVPCLPTKPTPNGIRALESSKRGPPAVESEIELPAPATKCRQRVWSGHFGLWGQTEQRSP